MNKDDKNEQSNIENVNDIIIKKTSKSVKKTKDCSSELLKKKSSKKFRIDSPDELIYNKVKDEFQLKPEELSKSIIQVDILSKSFIIYHKNKIDIEDKEENMNDCISNKKIPNKINELKKNENNSKNPINKNNNEIMIDKNIINNNLPENKPKENEIIENKENIENEKKEKLKNNEVNMESDNIKKIIEKNKENENQEEKYSNTKNENISNNEIKNKIEQNQNKIPKSNIKEQNIIENEEPQNHSYRAKQEKNEEKNINDFLQNKENEKGKEKDSIQKRNEAIDDFLEILENKNKVQNNKSKEEDSEDPFEKAEKEYRLREEEKKKIQEKNMEEERIGSYRCRSGSEIIEQKEKERSAKMEEMMNEIDEEKLEKERIEREQKEKKEKEEIENKEKLEKNKMEKEEKEKKEKEKILKEIKEKLEKERIEKEEKEKLEQMEKEKNKKEEKEKLENEKLEKLEKEKKRQRISQEKFLHQKKRKKEKFFPKKELKISKNENSKKNTQSLKEIHNEKNPSLKHNFFLSSFRFKNNYSSNISKKCNFIPFIYQHPGNLYIKAVKECYLNLDKMKKYNVKTGKFDLKRKKEKKSLLLCSLNSNFNKYKTQQNFFSPNKNTSNKISLSINKTTKSHIKRKKLAISLNSIDSFQKSPTLTKVSKKNFYSHENKNNIQKKYFPMKK